MKRAALAIAWLLVACSDPEVSQVMLRIEADSNVRAMTGSLEVQIDGGETRGSFSLAETLTLDGNEYPRVIALAPKNDDPNRFFRIVARARRSGVDDPTAEIFVQAALVGTYVRGETRTIVLRLEDSCIDVPCGANQHCASSMCREPPLVEPEPIDGGMPPSDMGMPDMEADRCVDDGDCDDGVECTLDTCTTGRCQHMASDASCPDSGSVCRTIRCDATLGCLEGPIDGPCDNDVFCDGADACVDGSCVAVGPTPCVGESTCDESGQTCTGCTGPADCSNGETCMGGTCVCPGAGVEACGTPGDEDCDGLADCADSSCNGVPCGANGLRCIGGACACAGTTEVCGSVGDEDCNGLADCGDPACGDGSSCGSGRVCSAGTCVDDVFESVCDDGVDNDGDGDIDCLDFDCDGSRCMVDGGSSGFCNAGVCEPDFVDDGGMCGAPEPEDHDSVCDDGIDNDCDGFYDCDDDSCELTFACCAVWGTCDMGIISPPDGGVSVPDGF